MACCKNNMKEVFEEYGGVVIIGIIGLIIVAGFFEMMQYLKTTGIM